MSLKKIAEIVGVSPSTVSRVLNNTSASCASREIRDKIFETARAIGYQPNENARNLRNSSKNHTVSQMHICIVLARIHTLDADPFFYELFRSLEYALIEQSMTISHVIYADDKHLDQKNLADDIAGSDGVIILGRCSKKLLEQILSWNRSAIGIWRNSMDFNLDEVVCDGKKAAELAMKHLISLGHKNIAYIGDCSYESRYVGYCNSLINYNIPMNYNWVKQTDQTGEAGGIAFHELLGQPDDFTAVFCANDITAVNVLKILHEKRRTIQRNISVISIDDIEESQNTRPMLTTIHIPRDEMAHMAVMVLMDRIAKKHSEPVRIEFPCRIVKRDSCSSPSHHLGTVQK